MKLFEPSYMKASKLNLSKLILEKYLDIAIMTILNIHAWYQYPNLSFWGTPWNIINSIFVIIWIIYLVIYPIFAFIVISMGFKKGQLESDDIMERFGILFEE